MDPAVVQYVSRMEAAVRAAQAALSRLSGENETLRARVQELEGQLSAERTRVKRPRGSDSVMLPPPSVSVSAGPTDAKPGDVHSRKAKVRFADAAGHAHPVPASSVAVDRQHRSPSIVSGRGNATGLGEERRSHGSDGETHVTAATTTSSASAASTSASASAEDELGQLIGEELAKVDWSSSGDSGDEQGGILSTGGNSALVDESMGQSEEEDVHDADDDAVASSSDSDESDNMSVGGIENGNELGLRGPNEASVSEEISGAVQSCELGSIAGLVASLSSANSDYVCAAIFQGAGKSASACTISDVHTAADFARFVSDSDDMKSAISYWVTVMDRYRAALHKQVVRQHYVQQTSQSRATHMIVKLQNRLLGKLRLQRGNTPSLRALCNGPSSEWSSRSCYSGAHLDGEGYGDDDYNQPVTSETSAASKDGQATNNVATAEPSVPLRPQESYLHSAHVYVITRVILRHMAFTAHSSQQSLRGFAIEVIATATTCRNVAALVALALELTDLIAQGHISGFAYSDVLAALRLAACDFKETFDVLGTSWAKFADSLLARNLEPAVGGAGALCSEVWDGVLAALRHADGSRSTDDAPYQARLQRIMYTKDGPNELRGTKGNESKSSSIGSKIAGLGCVCVRRLGFWRALAELSVGFGASKVGAKAAEVQSMTETLPGPDMLRTLRVALSSSNHPIVSPKQFMETVNTDFTSSQGGAAFWRCMHLITSALLSEYDPYACGWRVGARSLGETLDYRLSGVIQLVQKAMLILNIRSPDLNDVDTFDGATSLRVETWRSAVACLKACCSSDTLLHIVDRDPGFTFAEHAAETADGLLRHLHHVLVILSVHAMELFIVAVSESAKRMVMTAANVIEYSNEDLESIVECIRFISYLPEPWGINARGEWACLIATLYAKLRSASTTLHRQIPMDVNDCVGRLRSAFPAMVINLKRRPDRMSRLYRGAQEHGGLTYVRFPAVDGMDKSSQINKSIVTTHWDSTFNAQFDSNCYVDARVVMSESERACALSHVLAWLCISKLKPSAGDRHSVVTPSSAAVEAVLAEHLSRNEDIDIKKYLGQLRALLSASDSGRRPFFYPDNERGGLFCLILEDDAVFRFKGQRIGRDVSVASYLRAITRALPEDCDICYLGYAANRDKQEHYLENQSSMFFVPTYLWQLHGYLISPRGAAKLLAHLPVNEPVDNFVGRLCHQRKLKCLAVRDQVILQDKTAAGKSSSSSALRKTVDSDIAHSGGGIRADRAAGDKSAPRRGNKRRKFSGASSK